MNWKKRGQSAAGTAVLLAIIAAFLIMFVILIPPQDRAELLDGEGSTVVPGDEEIILERNLLIESPGRIDYLAQKEIEHPLPVVNVYTQTGSEIIAEKNLARAKKGVFTEEMSEFRFNIADLEHTEDVLLHFNVEALEGRLQISLNGEEIYNAETGFGAITPIPIPKNALLEENLIVFSVSSPGIAFWKTNELYLNNIRVVADITNVEAQFSKHIFLVSETEKQSLEKVVLRFQPDCTDAVSKLKITINGNEIYHAMPDCDITFLPIEFSPDLVQRGENEIIFSTETGTYILSHVLIRSELEEVDFPTYYFDLSLEEYDKVWDEELRVRVRMEFVDVVSDKYGEIVFNGHSRHFDTKEIFYTIDLSDDVVRGSNSLKIKPQKTIEVRELRVDLVE